MRHGRALAAACAAIIGGSANAQDCKGPDCPGQKIYPKFESRYIKQFCGPTIIAGSCHGHFPTQWRRWEDSCPSGTCAVAEAAQAGPVSPVELPAAAPAVEPPAAPPAPKPAELPKLQPAPDTGKGPTATAPKELLIPAIPTAAISIPVTPPAAVAGKPAFPPALPTIVMPTVVK